MPVTQRANPIYLEPQGGDEESHAPRMLYVDFAQLEATVSGPEALRVYKQQQARRAAPHHRVTTVDNEVTALRSNVQDAARALLTWLASITQHAQPNDADAPENLDRVLDRCLRPGSDTTAINYSALTEEVNRALGTDFSPKRIQTAVRHLRDAASQSHSNPAPQRNNTLAERFDALYCKLQTQHDELLAASDAGGHVLRRAVAHDVLAALRASAGRLIECGYGEGIPDYVDLDATRERFLAYIRRAINQSHEGTGLREDLDRLLAALRDHDDSSEADMQLVVAGANVVADLVGPDSLAGLMARLNLLMVGRPMLESEFFVAKMLELAEAAGQLVHDRATQTDMAWVRLQPQDRRTPSPNRVRSYCLNNAATHILQRLHTGDLTGQKWFATAQQCYETMYKHDRGFRLLKTTEAIMLCVLSDMTHSSAPAEELFNKLGYEKSLELLGDLTRFDNSPAINQLVRTHADLAHPGIASQLLVIPE